MKKTLTLLFLLPGFVKGQFTHFNWDSNIKVFSAVQMKVQEGKSQKVIFDGYKDSDIEIVTALGFEYGPTTAKVSIKLGGYFEMNEGNFNSFEYKVDSKGETEISYSFTLELKMAALIFYYSLNEKYPNRIFIYTVDNVLAKPQKGLVFNIKGFE